jgi:gamma-glutamyl:cysteine ligase YbdK (ATP-grasp superfamily)
MESFRGQGDIMGQEIADRHFRHRDFEHFRSRLHQETARLHDWFEAGRFDRSAPRAGLELEAWLVEHDGRPAPRNADFLAAMQREDVVHELARFNVEINAAPQPLTDSGLATLHASLQGTWIACRDMAERLGLGLVSIGILPTLRDEDLQPANMSDSGRYRALNEQVLRQRHGRPIELDIPGPEPLRSTHRDVMLEAGATSFQGHLQVTPENAGRYFNASVLASAATVAIAANSPFLFDHRLWEETRIPLFEQAVAIGSGDVGLRDPLPRVGFGSGYAGWSLAECFRENADRFPIMLPLELEDDAARLPHLRLHNGTIWRWNRPLIGFDDAGVPHLRIEHRVMAAGPSIADMMANLVFYYGVVAEWASRSEPPEMRVEFAAARRNFYAAARHGLDARVVGSDGREAMLRDQILEELLPLAQSGLQRLGAWGSYTTQALAIVDRRVAGGQTGAAWQRHYVDRHGADAGALTMAYAARQRDDTPVHEWPA